MEEIKSYNNVKDLFECISENLTSTKKIILIAGASSSGKSYMAEKLKQYFERKGKTALQFSSDMYYKGISKLITEKVFAHNLEFIKYLNRQDDITANVRKVIEFDAFSNKFSNSNYSKINEYLKSIMQLDDANKFSEKLKEEFSKVSFDEPDCIDFVTLSNDIEKLVLGKNIYVPSYSFATAETTIDYKNVVNGKNYDVIIVEGLYNLRDDLLNKLNEKGVDKHLFKVAVDCDTKTLLSRRFNRDINSNRVSFTPEETIMSFITLVMPSFYKYIFTTLTKADVIFNTSLTTSEINCSDKSVQIKYETQPKISKLLKQNGATLQTQVKQKDYFLEDKSILGKGIVLRIREENGLASKLSLKIRTSKLERAVQEYDLEKLLSKENRNINKLLTLFKSSGYEPIQVVSKTRKVYSIKNISLKIDNVSNLGTFVEIDSDNLNLVNNIKNLLELENPTTSSYYEMYLNNLKNLAHKENELKFVVKNLDENVISKIYKTNEIKQYYLNLNSLNVKNAIDKTFNYVGDLSSFSEARVRVVNNSEAFVTLKSGDLNGRVEMEKEVPITFALDLARESVKMLEKNRYEVYENNGKKVEIDFYKKLNLCIMEIEYEKEEYFEEEIENFAKNIFGSNIEVENVTNNKEFKNVNLAESVGESYGN